MLSSLEVSEREFARRLGQVTQAGDAGAGRGPADPHGRRTAAERFHAVGMAYAELLFTPRMWPEFEAADLAAAVEDFLGRERRFGRLPEAAAS